MGAQLAIDVVVNLAVAFAAGVLLLARDASDCRRYALAATIAALCASAALLWLEAAQMGEVPLAGAGSAAWTMLTATHYGLAWKIGATALAAAILLGAGPPDLTPGFSRCSLLALAVFLYSRSMVSHAASEGDIGIAIAIDWMHRMAISVWVGEVLAAGFVTLARNGLRDSEDIARHVQFLSSSATMALAVVVATGAFNAWSHIGSPGELTGHPYGVILLAKLALVGAAVALGGFNRFVVMPSVLAGGSVRRFVLALRVEAVVLAIVLVLAALLGSTAPPAA